MIVSTMERIYAISSLCLMMIKHMISIYSRSRPTCYSIPGRVVRKLSIQVERYMRIRSMTEQIVGQSNRIKKEKAHMLV